MLPSKPLSAKHSLFFIGICLQNSACFIHINGFASACIRRADLPFIGKLDLTWPRPLVGGLSSRSRGGQGCTVSGFS